MAGGFDSLGLMPELIRAADEIGWYLPTDVQDEAIPLILGGGDVIAISIFFMFFVYIFIRSWLHRKQAAARQVTFIKSS